MTTALVILTTLLTMVGAQCQEALTLSGVVHDNTTGRPVVLATVSVVGDYAVQDEQTDKAGIFVLKLISTVKPGQIIRLRIVKEQYETYDEQIAVASILPKPILLTPKAKLSRSEPGRPPTHHTPTVSFLIARGHVATAGGAPVGGTQIFIHDGPSSVSTKYGDFRIDNIPPPFTVGFPVTFEVVDWVIEDPFVGKRGRIYLPDPKAEPISLVVCRPGDEAFLQAPSIEKILGSRVFFFETHAKSRPADTRPSQETLTHEAFRERSVYIQDASRLRPANFRSPAPDETHRWQIMSDWDEFLSDRAKEIRIPKQRLIAAIEQWSTKVKTNYQKGLLALYRDDYALAAESFNQALKEGNAPVEQLYMSLAYGEYRKGNFLGAQSLLQRLIDLHPQDPILQESFDAVHRRSEKMAKPSSGSDDARFGIAREVLSDMENENYEAVYSLFEDDYSRGQIPGSSVKYAFSVKGKLISIGSQNIAQLRDESLYVTKCNFERGAVDFIIRFGATNRISGLWFITGRANLSDQLRRNASDLMLLISGKKGETFDKVWEVLSPQMRVRLKPDWADCERLRHDDRDPFSLQCDKGDLLDIKRIEVDTETETADVYCLFSKGGIVAHISFDPNTDVSDISYEDFQGLN
jgi:tetratricopeptide (TPR) repeat protein